MNQSSYLSWLDATVEELIAKKELKSLDGKSYIRISDDEVKEADRIFPGIRGLRP